jgi:hypothetical protein
MRYRLLPLQSLFTALVLGIVGPSDAGPLKPQFVAADAQWMAHVNVEAMVNAPLVKHVLDNPERFHIEMDGLEQFTQHTGLDPLKDIRDVTAYGNGDPHDGEALAIVTVAPVVDQTVEKIKSEAPSYREITANGYTVHSFKDEDHETLFFSVRSIPARAPAPAAAGADRLVLLSHSLDKLIGGLEVLDGKTPSLASAKPADSARPAPGAGSFIFIAANSLSWIERHHDDDHDPASALLRNSEQITIDIGEAGPECYINGSLAVGSTEDAANAAKVLQGLVALGKIMSNDEGELSGFGDLFNGIDIESTGNHVKVTVKQSTDRLIQALDQAAAMHHDDDDDGNDDEHEDDDHHRHHDHAR